MNRAVYAAVFLAVTSSSAASAQDAQGNWKIEFGKWVNEDHPNANMQFVPTANLALRITGDSVIATFTPEYPDVQAPVAADTLRGVIRDGRVTLSGSKVMKTRRVQRTADGEEIPSDEGEAATERATIDMEIVFADGGGTGKMRMQAGEMAKFAAPMKLKRAG